MWIYSFHLCCPLYSLFCTALSFQKSFNLVKILFQSRYWATLLCMNAGYLGFLIFTPIFLIFTPTLPGVLWVISSMFLHCFFTIASVSSGFSTEFSFANPSVQSCSLSVFSAFYFFSITPNINSKFNSVLKIRNYFLALLVTCHWAICTPVSGLLQIISSG